MSGTDFDEIAALWQESGQDDRAALDALAARARRQAKLLGYADVAMGVLLATGMVLGVLMEPAPTTGVIALLLITATLWVNWKRRGLRQMTLTLESSDRESFFRIATRTANANLRRLLLSMYLVPAFMLLAILFRLSIRNGGRLDRPFQLLAEWAVSLRGMAIIAVVFIVIALQLRARRRVKAELRRLQALALSYRDEDQRDRAGSAGSEVFPEISPS